MTKTLHSLGFRRRLSWSRAIPLFAASTLAAALGCDADGQLNPAPRDAGAITPPPDAGTDAAVRKLVDRPLFGQMPLDNRVHDPGFAQIDGVGWMPYDYRTEELFRASRVFLPRTPLDQPALRLEKEPQHAEASVTGDAKGAAGPVTVSVWLGRPVGQDPLQDVTVALLGLFLDDQAGAVDLAPDDPSTAVTLSDIGWQRVSANMADGPVAFASLRIATTLDGPLYLTSPILVGAQSSYRMRSANEGARRPLTTAEAAALRGATERQRERFRRPDPRPPRPSQSGWR